MEYTQEHLDDAYALGIRAATLRNPVQEWLRDAVTVDNGDTGVAVTYNTALSYSSVFSAVSMISGDIAGLPLNVQRVDANGDKSIENSHPAQWLLNEEPNEDMDALTFRETLQSHVLLWGNAYAAIVHDGAGRPTRLIPMLPDRTKPMKAENGQLYYESRDEMMAEPMNIAPWNVLHVKGLGWDGLQGHSVISLARRSWGLGIAGEKHGARSFKNNARPSITLETDARLTEEEADKLQARWEERQGGENQNRPAVLTGGVRVKPFSMSNEDAQWLESRSFQRIEVAAWFRIPPHKIGDPSRTAYNSLESENKDYVNRCLRQWLKKWESECRRKLIPERVRRARSVCIVHDTEDLLSADIETQTDVLVKLRAAEVVNRNEIRRKLGWSNTGPEGDDYRNPNTRAAGQSSGAEDEPQESEEPDMAEAAAAIRSAISQTAETLIKSERTRAINGTKSRDFVGWIDGFYQTFTGKMEEAMKPLIYAYTTLPGCGCECELTAAEVAESHAAESRDHLLAAAGIAHGAAELKVHVTEAVERWPERAEAIAAQICEGTHVSNP